MLPRVVDDGGQRGEAVVMPNKSNVLVCRVADLMLKVCLLEVDRLDLDSPFKLRCDQDRRRLPCVAWTSCHVDWLLSESFMNLPKLP